MSLSGTSSYGLFSVSNKSGSCYDSARIAIAGPDEMRLWSFGEVTKPDTINYRTLKPEKDGLFCGKIFGPIRDYECLCGKYKKVKYKSIVCEKCGVEVTSSKVRRERMGHIELASPVCHIWFLKSLPSRISTLLSIPLKDVERVVYFESYVVIDGLMSPLEEGKIMTEQEYDKYQEEYGIGSFVAMSGAEAIQRLLSNIDLKVERDNLKQQMLSLTSELKREKVIKRLKLVDQFLRSGNKPEFMILNVLPVIPPDLRPLVMLNGGRFASSDLNELYRRVINRNNRLKKLISLSAPEVIIKNEKRMLQESVDALFDNNKSDNPVKSSNKKILKSLSDMLKGKQGRFRQNLLGKRVDYSGRSVIVVGPELKLHQCGIPKKMALELFRPFIYHELEKSCDSASVKNSKDMVDVGDPKVWDILGNVIKEHPVLLNRAPTLHRLSIQAFEPVLTEGKAIQLHPLVCAAFNADFDGDQMAVHVPLSLEAQLEARVLMMSTNNILSPASGRPIIVPSQDIVLGIYYLTIAEEVSKNQKVKLVSSYGELQHALNSNDISIHTTIKYRYQLINEHRERYYASIITTPGRIILCNILPNSIKNGFDLVNRVMDKKTISNLIDTVYRNSGQKDTVVFCDKIMELGFRYATKSGISIGKEDMVVPGNKFENIDKSNKVVKKLTQRYTEGLITNDERYNKVIDEWTNCSDKISKKMMEDISVNKNDPMLANSIYMMADSGARGAENQIKQLSGMRGLMAKPSGEIIETPITSNFKEGLNVAEYFISAHGARKGLADMALKTANSGYLTRRLVDVSQDCIVIEKDCNTKNGIDVKVVVDDGRVIVPIGEQVLGRVSLGDVKSPKGEILVKSNTIIDEISAELIEKNGINSVCVRSSLACKSKNGICARCYGRDLATGNLVNIGEAVGVVAAQSIGEPGTQLTMRTFHIGGAASRGTEQSSVSALSNGFLDILDDSSLLDKEDKYIVVGRNAVIRVVNENRDVLNSYKLPYGASINYRNNSPIKEGDVLSEWDPYNIPIITESSGKVKYYDLLENISLKKSSDESSNNIVIDWRKYGKSYLKPRIAIIDDNGNSIKEYLLSVGSSILVQDGEDLDSGTFISKVTKESSKNRDITGGLPRVADLFEARRPKNSAIINEVDGVVSFGKDYKIKRKIIITPNDSDSTIEYMVSKGRHVFFNEGDKVKKGDILVDGNLDPHDILRVLGIKAFVTYMVDEVQKVYRMQGVKINDKHIEVVLTMMLKKVEIVHHGDTTFLMGEQIDKDDFSLANKEIVSKGLNPAKAIPVLLGITKASLQTKSFISAASFQETTKVLIDAAIQGKSDNLTGLKENVIVGRSIPAGTGLIMKRYSDSVKELSDEYKTVDEKASDLSS